MKLKCPNCQSDLRYIASSQFFLCNDCGFTIQGSPNPIAPPPPSQPNQNPIFQRYKPWQLNPSRFAFLGLSLLAIAVVGMGIKQYQQYLIGKRIDTEIAKGKELITEIKGDQIELTSLSPYCQPREHVHLTYKMFNECFVEGLTYYQIADMIGHPGQLVSQNGSITIYQWTGNKNSVVSLLFKDSKLSSKSQVNLNLDIMADYDPSK